MIDNTGWPEVMSKGNEVGLGISDRFSSLHRCPEIDGSKVIQLFIIIQY